MTETASGTAPGTVSGASSLLGASDIRSIASRAGISPAKKYGQNFVIDPGTVRKITALAGPGPSSTVIEVGPGLGSLTLALLETGAAVFAVEIDPKLAGLLSSTVETYMPQAAGRLHVIRSDALELEPSQISSAPASLMLVSNLPYNAATPIILTLLERFPGLSSFVVMVQKEVAERLAAQPGSKVYGVPSVKLAWYGTAQFAGVIGRNVFWPAPHIDSALVEFHRHTDPQAAERSKNHTLKNRTFLLIDKAFGQRRKTLRSALKGTVGDNAYRQAGIDASRRGETLTIKEFEALAQAEISAGTP
ncbi:MAG: 16S rRNA (adenine(1518)-N(6)/adenine(1519)-N(6))-dimethyltransferase RsmA [Scardovia wiggsiae]